MFEAEGEALAIMAQTGTVRVPEPICWGADRDQAWLALEYLPLGGEGSQALLGEQLATMHRHGSDRFGWHRDNTIGSTPQQNHWQHDWVDFFRSQRLGFQLLLASQNGHGGRLLDLGERLDGVIADFFDGYRPVPSMLHGDLWGGNVATDDDGQPVIFDPAFYYGDREADIAMTELFGGFTREFYSAYNHAWPLDSGYAVRKTLYNLYHIINHLNLFGGGYARQAESMMERLLSERN
jgi:fructosamine-3-kinase